MPPSFPIASLLALSLFSCLPSPEFNCSDGLDDDGDGLVDCNDPDCARDAACEPRETGMDTGKPTAGDLDGDGYTEEEGDCDDSDAAVNPAASEVCDGIDNDCDGTVDENDAVDAATW